MRQPSFSAANFLVRMLCAVSFLFVSLAAPSVEAEKPYLSPAQFAQARLPDGSLPVICVTYRTADGKEHNKIVQPACSAVLTASADLLPVLPVEAMERVAFPATEQLQTTAEPFSRALHPPNTGPRAPPSLPINML